MKLLASIVALSAVLLSIPLPAQDAKELEKDHSVVSQFVTPHTAWAKPYALGKARALFFVQARGTEPREVIELMQRFDLDAQMAFWARIVDTTREGWHGGDLGVRRINRLLQEKWDVFVFLGVPIERLPREPQYNLLKAVTEGTGLVLVGVDDKRVLKPKNLLTPLPAFLAPGPVGEAFRVKQGRGIRLPARPNIAYRVGWESEYDYWQEQLGRATLWAAGKSPQVELTVAPTALSLDLAALPKTLASVHLRNTPRNLHLKMDVSLRRDDGEKISLPPIACNEAEATLSVSAPGFFGLEHLRAGDYHLDVIARSRRGVEAFAACALNLASARRVAEIKLDRDWAEVGEQIKGSVTLEGKPLAKDELLCVSLFDRRGRELARQKLNPSASSDSFSLPVTPWLPMLVRAQATLFKGIEAECISTGFVPFPPFIDHRHGSIRGHQEMSSAYQFFRVTKRNRGQFNFLIWDLPRGTLGAYGEESLARTGTTLQLAGGRPPLEAAAFDIAWVPYTTRIMADKDKNGIMKPCCWNDENRIAEHVDGIVSPCVLDRGHGVFVYSLGDEGVTRGSCLSPQCLQAYRRYLKGEYGDIAALNKSWGTTFAAFDDVVLSNPTDNDESDSLRKKDYARWFDRRAFQSYNFARLCERFGKAFRLLDPQSKCGFEGAGTFQGGDDLDLIVRSNTFWSPYPGTADEVLRSIAPREYPRANWMGYTKDADSLLQKYWRMVTRGCDAAWWWRWDGVGRFHGWLSPTLDPFPAVKDILHDTQIVRDGLGDLLLASHMEDDGVAVLFSHPSSYANRIEPGTSYGSYEKAHDAWHSAIRNVGLQFRYVTDRMLRLGEFKKQDFKVMILAQIEALGPKEAEVVRDFVRSGGTLIADLRPALYDGHCKPLQAGALDDVFGIKRTGSPPAETADVRIVGTLGGAPIALDFSKALVDAAVQPSGANALGAAGKTPICLLRNFGLGRAVLLNFSMTSFPSLASPETPAAAADFIEALFALAHVQPAFKLVGADGKRLRNIEVTRWSNGRTQIFSLFRQSGGPEPVRIVPTDRVRVYDLRARKYLGLCKEIKAKVIPSRAGFFALTTEKVPAPDVQLQMEAVAPGKVAQVHVAVPKSDGLRAVRIRAKTPKGQPADWFDRVIVVGDRGADIAIPIAFNDPYGAWTITAVELFSNRARSAKLTVK